MWCSSCCWDAGQGVGQGLKGALPPAPPLDTTLLGKGGASGVIRRQAMLERGPRRHTPWHVLQPEGQSWERWGASLCL